MRDSIGDKSSRIWLIGDSPPDTWKESLRFPLDPHHPAVHNIWTPVLAQINDYLFNHGLRLSNKSLYIRNAVNDSKQWSSDWQESLSYLHSELMTYKPTIVITFGVNSYRITWKSINDSDILKGRFNLSWSLGNAFRTAISCFDINGINIFPLLHTSVSRGHFLKGQADFCKVDVADYMQGEHDYFNYTGHRLGTILYNEHFYKANQTLTSLSR